MSTDIVKKEQTELQKKELTASDTSAIMNIE